MPSCCWCLKTVVGDEALRIHHPSPTGADKDDDCKKYHWPCICASCRQKKEFRDLPWGVGDDIRDICKDLGDSVELETELRVLREVRAPGGCQCGDDEACRFVHEVRRLTAALETIERSGVPGAAIVARRADDHMCSWCRGMLTPCPSVIARLALRKSAPEPGQPIANVTCPCCGAHLEVEHGDEEGQIAVLGTPASGDDLEA